MWLRVGWGLLGGGGEDPDSGTDQGDGRGGFWPGFLGWIREERPGATHRSLLQLFLLGPGWDPGGA